MSSIVIVDLGTGNLRSVSKAVQHVAAKSQVSISSDPVAIAGAGHLILPGQGAIGTWINQLNANPGLHSAVLSRLQQGPVLGICLGLQALYTRSEENGGTPGLNLLSGTVRHFTSGCQQPLGSRQLLKHGQLNGYHGNLKIPHMGWNQVRQTRTHPLWHGIEDLQRFYFVHSYFVDSEDNAQVVGECEYGNIFTAAAARDNLFATQFHPEKSQQAGLQLLKNFVNWNGVQ